MQYVRLRGVKDIIPNESVLWEYIIKETIKVLKKYNYKLIITPTIENANLFKRSIGESDIVIKEMYEFKDKKGRDIVLRPEGTAGVVRAYIENSLPEKINLYYIGQMFRYEKPQKGRDREFYQIGVESFGDNSVYKDAETIILAKDIMENIKIHDYKIVINSIGCNECRPYYSKKLKEYFEKNKDKLCENCKLKIDRNPLRILDCKNGSCKKVSLNAPKIKDFLCENCKNKYEKLKNILKDNDINFLEDYNLVRGLDYYNGIVFEFITNKLGEQQNTILAGGRYDGLVKSLGGKNIPAIGFAFGIERCIEVFKNENKMNNIEEKIDIFIIAEEKYFNDAFKYLIKLRKNGFICDMNFLPKSFKSQMREANNKKAEYVIIIGEKEMAENKVSLKNMKNGDQIAIESKNLMNILKEKIEK